jgi:hypothetical protein
MDVWIQLELMEGDLLDMFPSYMEKNVVSPYPLDTTSANYKSKWESNHGWDWQLDC